MRLLDLLRMGNELVYELLADRFDGRNIPAGVSDMFGDHIIHRIEPAKLSLDF